MMQPVKPYPYIPAFDCDIEEEQPLLKMPGAGRAAELNTIGFWCACIGDIRCLGNETQV